MKIKPKNWDNLGYDRQMKHLTGKDTGVCFCNPKLGESCDICKDLSDIKEKDRNYHEEAIILARGMGKESSKDDEYWMYKNFLELDDPKAFNNNIRYYFIEEGYEFDDGYAYYHKSMRQTDYYEHLEIRNTNVKKDSEEYYVSIGNIDSLLHSFLNISEVPYQVIKKLLSL